MSVIYVYVILVCLLCPSHLQQTSVPKSQSAPEHSPNVIPPLEGNISNSHSNIPHANTRAGISKRDPPSTHSTKAKASSSKTNHKRNIAGAVDKIKQKKESKKRKDNPPKHTEPLTSLQDDYPTLQELVEGRREVPTCMLQSTEDCINERTNPVFDESSAGQDRYINAHSSFDKYIPISVSPMLTVSNSM